MTVRESLAAALSAAVERAVQSNSLAADEIPAIQLDVPPTPELGDFSSDLAIALARNSRQPPVRVAEILAAHLEAPAGLVEEVDVGGSGFLNFRLKPDWLHQVIREARRAGADFGKSDELGQGDSVQVEFVSAYPTGPLTVIHGRGAALGDALARVLEWNGYRVTREFYINDTGPHMERFGRSLEARYLQALGQADARVPIDGYADPYLVELAGKIREEVGDVYLSLPPQERLELLTARGRDAVVRHQKETLARFGVRFDEWYSEKALHENGRLDEVIDLLRRAGQAYERDGALWLCSTRFGDDEDRPLLRSNGRPTYIAADLAYHLEKFRRGFRRVIDVWGADHRDYIKRTRAGIQALGCDPQALEILIFQPVSLKIEGMVVDGAAQKGNNRLLDEVIDEVGGDIARFFYLMRPAGSPLDYDLDLARKTTRENPVRHVQQAHAEAQGILRQAQSRAPLPPLEVDLTSLEHPCERALMRKLSDFPDEVRAAGRERDPHRLTRYAREVAAAFEACRDECPFPGDGDPARAARLALVDASAIVLRNALTILGVSAPDGPSSI